MFKILIVDDEKISRMRIKLHLKDFYVGEADSYDTAIKRLNENFDLVFIDLNLDDQSTELFGLEVLKIAVTKGIYSVVMSSVEDEEVIEHAYEIGCKEFYNKGREENSINEVIQKFLLQKENHLENYFLKEVFPTQSIKQKELIQKIVPFIKSDVPICLLGETGSGKTYLASKIHEQSKRSGDFVEVNCSALSEELLDAELFGHHKGAYSGAINEQKGKLLLANNGTLFLDEIGSMSEKMQAKLLKAIEEKSFYPINSDKKVNSDFRIISATLDNLELKIKSGTFRFDLYQRICGFTTTLLPLRERKEDILPLLKNEIEKNSDTNKKIILSKETKDYLTNYNWPGNIRQLKRVSNFIKLQDKGLIQPDDLKSILTEEVSSNLVNARMHMIAKEKGLGTLIDMIEEEIVKATLKENNYSIRKTMKDLSINQSKVYKFKGTSS